MFPIIFITTEHRNKESEQGQRQGKCNITTHVGTVKNRNQSEDVIEPDKEKHSQ